MDNSFLHRKKLLLVDDEPELLKMVSDILKDGGFETVLTHLQAFLDKKDSSQITSHIFIQTNDDQIILKATDYEISISCKINANIDNEGTIVLPGKYLYEVIRTLPGEYVEIKNNNTDNSVNISSNTAQFNLLNE